MIIEIRNITIEDSNNIVKWRNQPEVLQQLYTQEPLTIEKQIAYFENYIKTNTIVQFIIVVDGIDCGTIFLKNIDYLKLEAELGIFIGEKKYRGKGVSKTAISKVLDYAFSNMGLKRIYLTVFENNTIAINSYKRAGFEIVKIIKNGYNRANVFYNIVEMEIIRN